VSRPLPRRVALALAAALAASACAGAPRVRITDAWPERVPSYEVAHDRWTRQASARRATDTVIDVSATLKSTEWRAAYVLERARRQLLPDPERARLLGAARAEAAEVWEVQLLVATHDWAWNDLAKRAGRSMWRVALVGDEGREVEPISIRLDRRHRGELQAWYPDLTRFHRAYVVTFPRVAADGRPLVREGSPRIALKIGSVLASVELVWSAE
jgi:hypothetical protein